MKEFKINLENFSGPLDKILELIDKNKLDISQISLSKITDDFLKYLEEFKKENGQNEQFYEVLADFISVAVKLLLIKAKSLLPSIAEEEEEESDLENQLRVYKEFKKVSLRLKEIFLLKQIEFKRELVASKNRIFFSPGQVKKNDLSLAMKKFLAEYKELKKALKKVKLKEKVLDLEKVMAETYQFVKKIKEINFKKLIDKKEKIEIITVFTSLLHLTKKGVIEIEQNEPFSEIKIKLLK